VSNSTFTDLETRSYWIRKTETNFIGSPPLTWLCFSALISQILLCLSNSAEHMWNLYKAEPHGTENIFHIGQISALYKINNTDSSGRIEFVHIEQISALYKFHCSYRKYLRTENTGIVSISVRPTLKFCWPRQLFFWKTIFWILKSATKHRKRQRSDLRYTHYTPFNYLKVNRCLTPFSGSNLRTDSQCEKRLSKVIKSPRFGICASYI
jgi:hypothetical protein